MLCALCLSALTRQTLNFSFYGGYTTSTLLYGGFTTCTSLYGGYTTSGSGSLLRLSFFDVFGVLGCDEDSVPVLDSMSQFAELCLWSDCDLLTSGVGRTDGLSVGAVDEGL